MSSSSPAVFLSYASQDAASATRIAEALRAAGIEVWFDQDELVGGDAWDAKIRGQIKACTLFVPLISANTQARAEGYFRLEWHLAEQRTYLMAHDQPFLFPVVADSTTDVEARVPERFRERQWMRLDNTSPEAIAQRIAVTLSRPTKPTAAVASANSDDTGVPSRTSPSAPGTAPIKTPRPWLIPSVIGIIAIAALAVWQPWQTPSDSNLHPVRHSPASRDEGVSEVDSLLVEIWDQLNATELNSTNLDLATELCEQALELDRNNPDVWAAYAQVDIWSLYHKLDPSAERRASARDKVGRALQLDPNSFEARLAHACFIVRSGGAAAFSPNAQEAETVLQSLLREQPTEPRALFALGILYRNAARRNSVLDGIPPDSDPVTESVRLLSELSRHPQFAALAWHEIAWVHNLATRDFGAADAALDRAIAIEPFGSALVLKLQYAQRWHGDLDAAVEIFHQFPASTHQDDRNVDTAVDLFTWRRDTESILRVLAEVPRDWLSSNHYRGPKRLHTGDAYAMAGRMGAARVEWQAALDLLNRQLQDENNNTELLNLKGQLLWKLGNQSESDKVFQLVSEFRNEAHDPGLNQHLREGNLDEALERIAANLDPGIKPNLSYSAASLRLDPRFDPTREDPRFQALLARAEADPRLTPNPKIASDSEISSASQSDLLTTRYSLLATFTSDKSIAVLPLANMSPDAENAFFADGVHEDIIGSLTKVRALTVISRTSTLRFRDATDSAADIGEALGVRYLVQGSVRRAGNRVLVSVQLIDSTSDQTVWTEKYNRTLEDIFAVQAEISTAVADQLEAVLSPEEVALIEYRPTDNPEAYDAFLQFRSLVGSQGGKLAQKVALLEQAVALDPNYSQAWAQLAIECIFIWDTRRQRNDPELLAKAHHAVIEARRTGPDQPYAPNAQSVVAYREYRDFEAAVRYSLEAVAIDPTYAYASDRLGQWYFWLGQWSEAEHYTKLTLRNSPGDFGSISNLWLRRIYQKQERWNEIDTILKASQKSSVITPLWDWIASKNDFLRTGDRSRYLAALQKLTDPSREARVAEVFISRDFDRSIEILTQLEDGEFNRWNVTFDLSSSDLMEALIRFEQGNQIKQTVATTKAKTHLRNILEVNPKPGPWYAASLAICYALEGDQKQMEQSITQTRAISETTFWRFEYQANADVMIAIAYLIAGEEEHAIDLLVAANQLPGPNIIHREIDLFFIFDRLRGNPRFDALVEDTAR